MPENASARLAGIATRLRVVGDKGVTKEFRAALRGVAKPLVADVQAAARAQLPKSGGLNEHVARQKVTVSVPLTPRTAAVRLRQPYFDAKQTDSGYVRHPVFAQPNRSRVWVGQDIPQAAGWWTKTLQAAGPKVTAELIAVMKAIEVEINGRI